MASSSSMGALSQSKTKRKKDTGRESILGRNNQRLLFEIGELLDKWCESVFRDFQVKQIQAFTAAGTRMQKQYLSERNQVRLYLSQNHPSFLLLVDTLCRAKKRKAPSL